MKPIIYKFCLILIAICFNYHSSVAQEALSEFMMQIKTEIDSSNNRAVFSWDNDTSTQYVNIYRKLKDFNFILINTLNAPVNFFEDSNLEKGVVYEYKFEKSNFYNDSTQHLAYGYALAGWEIPADEYRGKVLLLIDHTFKYSLSKELKNFKNALIGDGWEVIIRYAPRQEGFNAKAILATRNIVRKVYEDTEKTLKAVVILGRVPVPYSGNIAVDGHRPDHWGAYPADVFYAEMDLEWTDQLENNTLSSYNRQLNIPFDGRTDPSGIPSLIDLEIGRIDLYNLPAFAETEEELLQRYIAKNIAWREGKIDIPRRAIIDDGFKRYGNETAAVGAWSNFSAILGQEAVEERELRYHINNNPYLLLYAGAPGSFNSVALIAYTDEYATMPQRGLFAHYFGSYHGDWDSPDNIMRAALASQPSILAATWGARPMWATSVLALNNTFGYAAKLTQNNVLEYQFHSQRAQNGIHIALMGDPTLSLFPAKQVEGFMYEQNGDIVKLSWQKHNKAVKYFLYSSRDGEDFEKVAEFDSSVLEYEVEESGIANYMIRALVLENVYSGSFYNFTGGAFVKIQE